VTLGSLQLSHTCTTRFGQKVYRLQVEWSPRCQSSLLERTPHLLIPVLCQEGEQTATRVNQTVRVNVLSLCYLQLESCLLASIGRPCTSIPPSILSNQCPNPNTLLIPVVNTLYSYTLCYVSTPIPNASWSAASFCLCIFRSLSSASQSACNSAWSGSSSSSSVS